MASRTHLTAPLLLAVVTALVWALQRSSFGFVLRAIRDDEAAVRSLGFSPARYKQVAMAVSAGIVGTCGGFFAQYVLFVDPPSVLALSLSVTIALIPILGGIGTVSGPIIGAAVLVPLSEYSRVWFSGTGRNVDLLIYGALIMLISVYRPQGLAGPADQSRRFARARAAWWRFRTTFPRPSRSRDSPAS